MRPIRLELEGFTAYREYTVLDFDDADLFVLTGPTGAGKSSLIDALTFALYGSVARYGNPNLVHPVISQGKLEAKVRFDFALRGEPYTAVRVVRRTQRGGATTKEARLEASGQVLAASADEVSRKVRELLGLNFEQFTTCVVLPQGEFARFLHEKPADRQDLLIRLLGVEIYERMGGLARAREGAAKQRVEIYGEELARLGEVEPGAEKRRARRVEDLEKLHAKIERKEPALDALEKKAESLRAQASAHQKDAALLEALDVPPGVEALAESLEGARGGLEAAERTLDAAEEEHRRAEAERAKLPSELAIHEADRARADLAESREEQARLALAAAEVESHVTSATERCEAARAVVDEARERIQELERDHAAHEVAKRLVAGEPCPVCGVTVASLPAPARKSPKALSTAESALLKLEKALAAAERELRNAEKERALAGERQAQVAKQIGATEKKLEKAPAPEAAEAARGLDAKLGPLERALAAARRDVSKKKSAADALRDEETRAYQELERARDRVAKLEPPATDRAKLGEAWTTLRLWARERAPRARSEASADNERAQACEAERKAAREALVAEARELEVPVEAAAERGRLRDPVYAELVSARHELEALRTSIARRKELRTELQAARETTEVAGAVGRHLRASGFERWLLTEAFRALAEQATLILKELSSGQYSFEYDDRLNFEVIDHRNADERRSARTLSGGESFLASLSLALTLAEQTAELAASGSAPIESLFLDEGFGTLDNDTLEIVGAAIQELGARGRVVGLVTHQQSLADQIPVQFRVSKGPVTSTVEKVTG